MHNIITSIIARGGGFFRVHPHNLTLEGSEYVSDAFREIVGSNYRGGFQSLPSSALEAFVPCSIAQTPSS